MIIKLIMKILYGGDIMKRQDFSPDYPKINFSNLERLIKECVADVQLSKGVSSGFIATHENCLVEIQVAKSEYWLHYNEIYPVECVRDKIKHLDKDKYSDNEYKVIQEVLMELLKQIE